MITWEVLRTRISRVLGDTTFTAADLTDYINQALVAISAHTALQKLYSQTVATDTTSLALPDDLLQLGPVHVRNGTVENNLYVPIRLTPGESLPALGIGDMRAHRYYRWGSTINLLTPILAGRTVELLYFAYWPAVADDADTIPVPRWMEEPLQWYSIHLAMAKPGASDARLRRWDTKQDSGNPEHNSAQKFAKFCLERYQSILNDAPSQDRNGWEANQ